MRIINKIGKLHAQGVFLSFESTQFFAIQYKIFYIPFLNATSTDSTWRYQES